MTLDNSQLNDLFPLASCPHGSLGEETDTALWYRDDLEGRMLAALFIEDDLTFLDVVKRLLVHSAYYHTSTDQKLLRTRIVETVQRLKLNERSH